MTKTQRYYARHRDKINARKRAARIRTPRYRGGKGRWPLEKFYSPEPNTGCWIWLGKRHREGYGRLNRDGKQHMAHRISWEQTRGPIPDGLEMDHLCRNKSCVNPAHLEVVTHQENMRRALSQVQEVRSLQAELSHMALPMSLVWLVRGGA